MMPLMLCYENGRASDLRLGSHLARGNKTTLLFDHSRPDGWRGFHGAGPGAFRQGGMEHTDDRCSRRRGEARSKEIKISDDWVWIRQHLSVTVPIARAFRLHVGNPAQVAQWKMGACAGRNL